MKAIIYLFKRSIINWIKKLKEKPSTLIPIILVVVFLFASFLTKNNQEAASNANINILYIIFFFLSLLFLALAVYSGLSSGTSFFSMPDVNLMFTSPISSNKILIYGVFKQLGRAFAVSIFMVFQIRNLSNTFALSLSQGIVILILYVGMIFISQIGTLGIYAFTSLNDTRKRIVKLISFGLLFFLLAFLSFSFYKNGLSAISSPLVYSFPISGWLLGILVAFFNKNFILLAISIFITLAFIAFVIFAMIKWQPDYYEDCLLGSENAFYAKQQMKGNRNMQSQIKRRRKERVVESIDFKRGAGPSSFFFKHIIEIKRNNKAFPFGLSSIGFLLLGVLLGLIGLYASTLPLYIALIILIYLNIFLVGISKVTQELTRQFIYMVPEPPFKKLLYISLSSLVRSFSDGILIFIPSVFIGKFSILSALSLVLAYSSAIFLIVASNLLIFKVFGKFSNNSLIILVFYVATLILLGPGISLGIITFVLSEFIALSFLIFALMNTLIAFLVFFICRNLVHDVDFLT